MLFYFSTYHVFGQYILVIHLNDIRIVTIELDGSLYNNRNISWFHHFFLVIYIFVCPYRFCHPGFVPGRISGTAVPAPSEAQGHWVGSWDHFLLCGSVSSRHRRDWGYWRWQRSQKHSECGVIHPHRCVFWTWGPGVVWHKSSKHNLWWQEIYREDFRRRHFRERERTIPV